MLELGLIIGRVGNNGEISVATMRRVLFLLFGTVIARPMGFYLGLGQVLTRIS